MQPSIRPFHSAGTCLLLQVPKLADQIETFNYKAVQSETVYDGEIVWLMHAAQGCSLGHARKDLGSLGCLAGDSWWAGIRGGGRSSKRPEDKGQLAWSVGYLWDTSKSSRGNVVQMVIGIAEYLYLTNARFIKLPAVRAPLGRDRPDMASATSAARSSPPIVSLELKHPGRNIPDKEILTLHWEIKRIAAYEDQFPLCSYFCLQFLTIDLSSSQDFTIPRFTR